MFARHYLVLLFISACKAGCSDFASSCYECTSNDCKWYVTGECDSSRRELGVEAETPTYANEPKKCCLLETECTGCKAAYKDCDWDGATCSYSRRTRLLRRKLGATSDTSSDVCGAAASTIDGTYVPKPIVERWWFWAVVFGAVLVLTWLGISYYLFGAKADTLEEQYEQIRHSLKSAAKEAKKKLGHGHDDHAHPKHAEEDHDSYDHDHVNPRHHEHGPSEHAEDDHDDLTHSAQFNEGSHHKKPSRREHSNHPSTSTYGKRNPAGYSYSESFHQSDPSQHHHHHYAWPPAGRSGHGPPPHHNAPPPHHQHYMVPPMNHGFQPHMPPQPPGFPGMPPMPGTHHPGMMPGDHHPGMMHGAHHPGMMHGAQHPGMMHGAQHPGMMHGAQHPGMMHGAQHPGMMHGAQHPGMLMPTQNLNHFMPMHVVPMYGGSHPMYSDRGRGYSESTVTSMMHPSDRYPEHYPRGGLGYDYSTNTRRTGSSMKPSQSPAKRYPGRRKRVDKRVEVSVDNSTNMREEPQDDPDSFRWSYVNGPGQKGPKYWGVYYPEAKGFYQSPINIDTGNMGIISHAMMENKQTRPNYFTKDEFTKLTNSLGLNLEREEIEHMFHKIDGEQKGYATKEAVISELMPWISSRNMENIILEAIQEIDTNNDRFIEIDEFRGLIKTLKLEMSYDEIEHMFSVIDIDSNGRLDHQEVVNELVPRIHTKKIKQDIDRALVAVDKERDGRLNRSEYAELIKHLGLVLSSQEINDLFKEADMNNSGEVNSQIVHGHMMEKYETKNLRMNTSTQELKLKYGPCKAKLVGWGQYVEWLIEEGSNSLSYGSYVYELTKIHYHIKSEHTLNGKHADLELQFFHVERASGAVAIASVLFNIGEYDPFIDELEANLQPLERNEEKECALDLGRLLEIIDHQWCRYEGSLTIPPCTEGYLWFLNLEPCNMSKKQHNSFKNSLRYKSNNRPIQPINNRSLTIVG